MIESVLELHSLTFLSAVFSTANFLTILDVSVPSLASGTGDVLRLTTSAGGGTAGQQTEAKLLRKQSKAYKKFGNYDANPGLAF